MGGPEETVGEVGAATAVAMVLANLGMAAAATRVAAVKVVVGTVTAAEAEQALGMEGGPMEVLVAGRREMAARALTVETKVEVKVEATAVVMGGRMKVSVEVAL